MSHSWAIGDDCSPMKAIHDDGLSILHLRRQWAIHSGGPSVVVDRRLVIDVWSPMSGHRLPVIDD